jgi:DNA-directed RNA polymerase subunit alpha
MAILAFQKPDKVIMNVANDLFGQFEFRPLEPGYGITIGNALRRILLSSLEGYAITSVKIDNVDHEFSTIKGVVEDVTEIVLNLKQVRFRRQIQESKGETISLTLTGSDKFTAADIGKHVNDFEVLNRDFVICNLDPKVKLKMELTIGKGRGYVPAEENKPATAAIGLIPIDSIFTPVRNVKFMVENFRVEQKTDYEKLIIEITTDGSISPKDALKEAADILIKHFVLFSDEKITFELQPKAVADDIDENSLHMRQLLKTKLADMDLSVRAMNCLKAADLETLGELVSFSKNDLLKFRNFGKKSLTELEELVKNKGLTFGMNLSKYKLDKD